MKRNKLMRIIKTAIASILIIATIFIGGMSYSRYKYQQKNGIKIEQTLDVERASMPTINQDSVILKKNLKEISKLMVLEGTINTHTTYSDEEILDSDLAFRTIRQWFNKSQSRSLNMDATYRFGFSYDMENIVVEQNDGKIKVTIGKDNIELEYCEMVQNETVYSDEIGWLSKGKFTPNELNTLNERNHGEAEQMIRSKKDLRDKAIVRVQKEVDNLCKKLGITADIQVTQYDVVEQSEGEMSVD